MNAIILTVHIDCVISDSQEPQHRRDPEPLGVGRGSGSDVGKQERIYSQYL